MDQGQLTLISVKNELVNKKSRVFKIQLDSHNTIAAYAQEVLKKSPEKQYSSIKQTHSQQYFVVLQQNPSKEDLYPPFYQGKKKKADQQNKVQKIKGENRNQIKVKTKQTIEVPGKKTLRNSREIDLHFSLSRLAFLVKLHIEHNHLTKIDRIYYDIFGKYLENFPKKTVQAQQVMIRVKRRILQVLRVFDGSEIIYFQRRSVAITELGKQKGFGLMKHLKRKKDQLLQRNKHLKQLIEYKDSLKIMINEYQRIRQRNAYLLIRQQRRDKEIAGYPAVKYKFACPLRMISGQSENNLTIFKSPKIDLIESVQCKNNRILIKGENLKIYSFGQALRLLAKQHSNSE